MLVENPGTGALHERAVMKECLQALDQVGRRCAPQACGPAPISSAALWPLCKLRPLCSAALILRGRLV